jgi:hypothetical protein
MNIVLSIFSEFMPSGLSDKLTVTGLQQEDDDSWLSEVLFGNFEEVSCCECCGNNFNTVVFR